MPHKAACVDADVRRSWRVGGKSGSIMEVVSSGSFVIDGSAGGRGVDERVTGMPA